MRPVKKKPKKKKASRAAKKSPKVTRAKKRPAPKVKRKAVAKPKPKRKPAAKPTRKVAAKPKRKVAAKAKRKPVAKPRPKAVAKPKAKPASPKPAKVTKPRPAAAAPRRDATGHLAPQYAADLHARSQESAEPKDAQSFVRGNKSQDPLAEEMGEAFVKTAISGEDTEEDTLNQVVPEESGGPFVESSGGTEFASGTDASNPASTEPEPFPTT
jgi:hypothetical protein